MKLRALPWGVVALCAAWAVAWSVEASAQEASWPDLMSAGPHYGGGAQDAAVVVGIEDYWQVADVPGAVDNALAWSRWLNQDRGVPMGRITVLTNADGTRERITEAVEQAASRVGRGGRLWFVFIGHGAASKDGLDGMLVGSDVQQNATSIYARSVSREQVLGAIKRARVPDAVLVLDTCFSGRGSSDEPLAAGLQPLVPVKDAGATRGVTVFTAGRGDQLAGPLPGASRPAFSYLLLGALRGWGDSDGDGVVSEEEAVDYVTQNLSFLLAGSRAQTPELWSADSKRALVQGSKLEAGPDVFALASRLRRGSPPASPPGAEGSRAGGASEMVFVPAGEFLRGSREGADDEQPSGHVYVSAFSIDKTEVTVEAYAACVRAGQCIAPDTTTTYCSGEWADQNNWTHRASRGDHPVNCVDWTQAVEYCRWAGKRLPTEAEWEKAARGTDGRKYPWGAPAPSCRYVVMESGGKGCGVDRTAPTGSKPEGASPYGALDMSGNVWEWVSDYHSSTAYARDAAARDPQGPASGSLRVHRGGSFYDGAPDRLRAAYRDGASPSSASISLGFRCARSMP